MQEADIINRIKELMKIFDLTPTKFAEKVGIPQGNFSKILNGKRPCGESIINKIVLATGCNKSWLTKGDEDKAPSKTIKVDVGVGEMNGGKADFKFQVQEETQKKSSTPKSKNENSPQSNAELQKEIQRLKRIIEEQKLEISKLNGKVEQQNETIKLLVRK